MELWWYTLELYATECQCLLYQEEIAINMQNLAFSEASGSPYCKSNVNSGDDIYEADLIFTD